MKLIEALKQTKDLVRKAEDLATKVGQHSAHMNYETPVYPEQKKQVREWVQAHSDIMKEILHLYISIQKTNLVTPVTIELGGKQVTKSIAEWVHRRRGLATREARCWQKLTDRSLKEGQVKDSQGQAIEARIIRCYDPQERDTMVALYESEPSIVDAKLEVVNAVTDLIED